MLHGLQKMVKDCGLTKLFFKGLKYTWKKRVREGI